MRPEPPGDRLAAMAEKVTIVILHSMRSTPEEYEAIFKPWVEGLPVRLVLPHGEPHERGGFTWFPPEYYKDPAAQVEIVAEVAGRIASEADGKIIVTGASQGGDLAFALAVLHPELVVAALPMLALFPSEIWPQNPTGVPPIHAFHGEADPIVGIDTVRAAADGLRKRGVPFELHAFPGVDHDLPEQMLSSWRAVLAEHLPGTESAARG